MRTRTVSLLTAFAFAAVSSPAMAQQSSARKDDELLSFSSGSPQEQHDVALEYRLLSHLGQLPGVDLGNVHVRIVRGAVTISGSVPSVAMHDRVLGLANTLDGVNVVRDELSVRSGEARGGGPADDGAIASGVRAAVASDAGVVGRPLEIASHHGVVSLSGHVATYRDALRVLDTARAVPGVRAVRPDGLTVNESVVVLVDGDRNARRR